MRVRKISVLSASFSEEDRARARVFFSPRMHAVIDIYRGSRWAGITTRLVKVQIKGQQSAHDATVSSRLMSHLDHNPPSCFVIKNVRRDLGENTI